jgi:hypothetical protein
LNFIFNNNINLFISGSLIFMTQETNEKDKQEVFTLYQTDGSFPIISLKVSLNKSKSKKKYDIKSELENIKMDMIQ